MPRQRSEEAARSATGLFGASAVTEYLEQVVEQLRDERGGAPSDSIPALAQADPERFGIVVATAHGHVYEAGDVDAEFSLQSISKAFTYGLALDDLGVEAVHEKMDVEPSGDAFNEISLQPGTGRPANPMINAGAITSTWLVPDSERHLRRDRIRAAYSRCAGRDLAIGPEVLAQEHDAGHRNRALGYLLASAGVIEGDPVPTLEDYFAQCSVLVTCRDLALMGATLANDRTQPVTGEEVFTPGTVFRVLSVMSSCGMYDDAGEWMVRVRLPAKSGVGGGIIAVLPDQLALATFSPALDRHGTATACAACWRANGFRRTSSCTSAALPARPARPCGRATRSTSPRPMVRRNAEAEAVLAEHGTDAVVVELQGDLLFPGAETAIRTVRDVALDAEYVVVDMRRVDAVADHVLPLLARTREELQDAGRTLVVVGGGPVPAPGSGSPLDVFPSCAAAVKWVEDALLERHGGPGCTPDRVVPADSELLSRLDPGDARAVRSRTVERSWRAGANILRAGQNFAGIHLVVSGDVSMSLCTPTGERIELQILGPGMSFGEMALGSGGKQHVTLTAVTDVTARVLTPEALDELKLEDPALALRLWKGIARDGYERVDQQWRDAAVHASATDW